MEMIFFIINLAIKAGRFSIMTKNASNVAKGLGIGMVTGMAALAIGNAVSKKNKGPKNMKKTAGKAVHTMGEILGGVESMLK